MVATETMAHQRAGARGGGRHRSSDMIWNVVNGLGWFSIGLGLAEVVAPGAVSRLIGVRNNGKNRNVLRGYGLRELAAGVGILTRPRPSGWIWSRVAGDVVDLASLANASTSGRNNKTRIAAATAAVAGITALDVICGQKLSAEGSQDNKADDAARAIKTIGVDKSPEETYAFWRKFENFPKFMTYLESVQTTGQNRSHWVAKGPGGLKVEWDAEVIRDEPNRRIDWRSVEGSAFDVAGSVRFERAPGNRGTLIRVEMDFAPNGGALKSTAGKILGKDAGERIQHDLRNFKQVMEIGEVTQSDASIHEGMHPAQPPEQIPVRR